MQLAICLVLNSANISNFCDFVSSTLVYTPVKLFLVFRFPKPTFSITKMHSTIMVLRSKALFCASDRRLIGRAVIIITERTGST